MMLTLCNENVAVAVALLTWAIITIGETILAKRASRHLQVTIPPPMSMQVTAGVGPPPLPKSDKGAQSSAQETYRWFHNNHVNCVLKGTKGSEGDFPHMCKKTHVE